MKKKIKNKDPNIGSPIFFPAQLRGKWKPVSLGFSLRECPGSLLSFSFTVGPAQALAYYVGD